jgi:hypothetical protein
MSENKEVLYNAFDEKYCEFIAELKEVYPELGVELDAAFMLSLEDRVARFREEVLPHAGNPKRDTLKCPGTILPGVTLTEKLWGEISENTKRAIQEYLTLLSFCLLLNDGKNVEDTLPEMFNSDMMNTFMNSFKSKLDGINLDGLAEKIGKMFQGDASGGFTLPERFMNGHIARLAHEIVRDIKPEDFGIDASMMANLEKNPSGALEILLNIFKSKPDFLQNSMKRIAKRIQNKVLSGEIKPQEIAREAEELMKEFINNPALKELMESFRGMFGFEDMNFARAAGREGSARLAIVKERLRKKMDAKKAASQSVPSILEQQLADAAAASLLAEESKKVKPKKR